MSIIAEDKITAATIVPSGVSRRDRAAQTASRLPRFRLISIATLVLALVLWWAASALHLASPLFLPSPFAVIESFVRVVTEGFADSTLWQHLVASVGRVFIALGFALGIAIPVGLLAGINPYARAIIDPVVEFLRPIPPLAYLPLIIIWCGIGEPSKILVLWLAIFPAILLSTMAGVKSVVQDRIAVAQCLGASHAQIARFVILPSALPSILTGTRIGLGSGWSTLVAAELVAATRGLGFMIQSAAQFLVTDVVIMGILVIAAVAFVFEAALRYATHVLTPWYGKT